MSASPDNPVEIVTFGCRLNAYESEAMKGRACVDDHLRRANITVNC